MRKTSKGRGPSAVIGLAAAIELLRAELDELASHIVRKSLPRVVIGVAEAYQQDDPERWPCRGPSKGE